MPNWCHNRVSVYSENIKQVDKLFDIFNNPEPFNELIPSPDWSKTPNEDGELPVLDEHKDADGKVVFTTNLPVLIPASLKSPCRRLFGIVTRLEILSSELLTPDLIGDGINL